VAVGGEASLLHVIDRRRLELGDASLPAQAYHAARGLPHRDAEALVRRAEASAGAAAERGLDALVALLRKDSAVAAWLALASGLRAKRRASR
jgi:hypothetical protein